MSSKDNRQVLSDQDVGEILRTADESSPGAERRRTKRFVYGVVQSMAPYDGTNLPKKAAFRQVYCHDLSTTGLSFLSPTQPDFEYVVVALGKSPRLTHVTAQVANCRSATRGFVVGCNFLAKVKL